MLKSEAEKLLERIKTNDDKLKTVNLANKQINEDVFQQICKALEQNTTVVFLNLENVPLTGPLTKYLAHALTVNKSINILDVSNCGFKYADYQLLFASLARNQTLKILSLENNVFHDQEIKLLIDFLNSDTAVNAIDLEHIYGVSENSMNELILALVNNAKLKSINLSRIPLNPEHVTNLLKGDSNVLTHLGISHANIELDTCLEALKNNNSLHSIDFSGNEIGLYGAKVLAELLEENQLLRQIDLSNTDLKDDDLKLILTAIGQSCQLQKLIVNENPLSESMLKQLYESLPESRNN